MKERLRETLFNAWYWYVSTADRDAEVTFMNYGYAREGYHPGVENYGNLHRYSAQLYHFVATGVDIGGQHILEIGCGRGGGLSYIDRALSPESAVGLDLNRTAIAFCREHYAHQNIEFVCGNAEDLHFEASTFDVVINIESSHLYPRVDRFLCEAHRVLKPGGHFLFADFRSEAAMERLERHLAAVDFTPVRHEVITPNVVEALDRSTRARERLIRRLAPPVLRGLARKFAALEGTPTYNKFAAQEMEYVYKVLRK